MTIDQIYNRGELSIRSYHACKYNSMVTIYELKQYLIKNKNFMRFQNCGKKSNEELIKLCNNYYLDGIDIINNENQKKITENPLKKIITELTRTQREVISSFILVNTNSLTARSKNGVSYHLLGNLKIKNFAEKILLPNNFNVLKMQNIGEKCVPEIKAYISIIKDFLVEVSQSDDQKYLISLKNNFLIQRTYSISKIPNDILETESIFLLTDFLLENNALFNKTNTIIVKKAFKIYQNQKELTLDLIADELNLT